MAGVPYPTALRVLPFRLSRHLILNGFLVVPGITKTQLPIPVLEVIAKLAHLTANSGIKQNVAERGLDCSAACIVNAAEINPVVTGVPSGKVASATVKGLNGFAIGTLMPLGLKTAPFGCLNGSGENPVAAQARSKNERVYLKSANTVKYLSQMSRVKEP